MKQPSGSGRLSVGAASVPWLATLTVPIAVATIGLLLTASLWVATSRSAEQAAITEFEGDAHERVSGIERELHDNLRALESFVAFY